MLVTMVRIKNRGTSARAFRIAGLRRHRLSRFSLNIGYLLAADYRDARSDHRSGWPRAGALVSYLASLRLAFAYPYDKRMVPLDIVLVVAALVSNLVHGLHRFVPGRGQAAADWSWYAFEGDAFYRDVLRRRGARRAVGDRHDCPGHNDQEPRLPPAPLGHGRRPARQRGLGIRDGYPVAIIAIRDALSAGRRQRCLSRCWPPRTRSRRRGCSRQEASSGPLACGSSYLLAFGVPAASALA